jgi:hypothetical protein
MLFKRLTSVLFGGAPARQATPRFETEAVAVAQRRARLAAAMAEDVDSAECSGLPSVAPVFATEPEHRADYVPTVRHTGEVPIAQAQAVRLLLADLMEASAGSEMRFADIAEYYDRQLTKHARWPLLSRKALSQHLMALGCTRRTVDLRHQGWGRPTMIRLPSKTGNTSPKMRVVA